VAVGAVLSILATVAVTLPVFPAKSLNVKINVPFPVNVCVETFVPVNTSFHQVSVATTLPLVADVIE